MGRIGIVCALLLGLVFAYIFGTRLSSDALGLAVGVVFGVLAGIPTALIVLAAQRKHRRDEEEEIEEQRSRTRGRLPDNGYQPPVIVIGGGYSQGYAQPSAPPPYAPPYAPPQLQPPTSRALPPPRKPSLSVGQEGDDENW